MTATARLLRIDAAALRLALSYPSDLARLVASVRGRQAQGVWFDARALGAQGWQLAAAAAPARLLAAPAVTPAALVAASQVARSVRIGVVVPDDEPNDGADLAAAVAARARWRGALPWLAWRGWPRCAPVPRDDLEVRLDPPLATPPGQFVAACDGCAARRVCAGWRPGLGAQPRSLGRTISNQADFVEIAASPPGAPGEDGASGDGRRDVWLDDGGDLRRFRCADVGFDDADLQAVRDRGQLYRDVSDKARLDDFAADLRALEPADAHRAVWRLAPGDPFAAEETALRAELEQLRGAVIDVGAGPVRYVGWLAAAIAAGAVRYLAVEPDGAALASLRRALPAATFARGVGEALPCATGSADAVIVLRAWNHLESPARFVAEAGRALRPGGTLLIVDNVAFGLLRSRDQAERAHAIAPEVTPFEHFRNDSAADVVAALAATGGWAVERVLEVGPGTSNQWLVRARRRTSA